MDKNIIELKHSKKTFYRFKLLLVFSNGIEEEVECTFFGASLDVPNFLIFSNAHPDNEEDMNIPDLMVNSDNLLQIRKLSVQEIDR